LMTREMEVKELIIWSSREEGKVPLESDPPGGCK
jgi:hypothetical protein